MVVAVDNIVLICGVCAEIVFAVVVLTKILDGDDDATGDCCDDAGIDGDGNLILKLFTRIF